MSTLKPNKVIEEIYRRRNHSLYIEVWNRQRNNLDHVILKYMGTSITYGEFFEKTEEWGRALKASGINKGDEVVVFLDKTPELVYLFFAASRIGAKIRIMSEKFDDSFLVQTINRVNPKLVFVQNTKLTKLADVFNRVNKKGSKIVPVDYAISKKNGFIYSDVIEGYYLRDFSPTDEEKFKTDFSKYIKELDCFLTEGKSYDGTVDDNSITLEDSFTITYSSGTTKEGYPKGITHKVAHYIISGRYHDKEISGIPEMKNLVTYSIIPVYSNSWISSALTDIVIKGGQLILDPIDEPEYFQFGLQIYNSHFNVATTSIWLKTAIDYFLKNRKYKLPNALFNFSAGEGTTRGEEKFLNRFFRATRAGIALTPLFVSMISTAGGACEFGSVLIQIFRGLKNSNLLRKFIMNDSNGLRSNNRLFADGSDPVGMEAYDYVEHAVLRDDGTHASPYEFGDLCVKTPGMMVEYDGEPGAKEALFRFDDKGVTWASYGVIGYMDEAGRVTIKGRGSIEEQKIPEFLVADEILKDTKNIMSCEVFSTQNGAEYDYIAYIMPQIEKKSPVNHEKILRGIYGRVSKKFGYEFANKLHVAFRDETNPFPLTKSGKRNRKQAFEELKQTTVYDLKDFIFNEKKKKRLKIRKKKK